MTNQNFKLKKNIQRALSNRSFFFSQVLILLTITKNLDSYIVKRYEKLDAYRRVGRIIGDYEMYQKYLSLMVELDKLHRYEYGIQKTWSVDDTFHYIGCEPTKYSEYHPVVCNNSSDSKLLI